jgi:hypothetical protein
VPPAVFQLLQDVNHVTWGEKMRRAFTHGKESIPSITALSEPKTVSYKTDWCLRLPAYSFH